MVLITSCSVPSEAKILRKGTSKEINSTKYQRIIHQSHVQEHGHWRVMKYLLPSQTGMETVDIPEKLNWESNPVRHRRRVFKEVSFPEFERSISKPDSK